MSDNSKRARELDWSKFESSMPREGVVRPTGQARIDLIARIKRALEKHLASGMSASGQDAKRLEAKPASPTAESGDAQ